ncbi:MAG: tetratricopeptide repeat protein [Desulfatiglandaceae bacterium]
MSSIHEALRRAERDRETRLSVKAGCLVSAGSRRRKSRRFLFTAGGLAAAVCLMFAVYFFSKSGFSRDSGSEILNPPANVSSSGTGVVSSTVLPHARPELERAVEDLKLFRMAQVLQQAGKLEEAGPLYEEICRLNPRFVQAKNNLGVVYLALEDYTAAEKAFLDATAMSPDYPDAYYNLACVYALTRRNEKALAALSRVINLEPKARGWALDDKDLAGLRHIPEFEKVISSSQ